MEQRNKSSKIVGPLVSRNYVYTSMEEDRLRLIPRQV